MNGFFIISWMNDRDPVADLTRLEQSMVNSEDVWIWDLGTPPSLARVFIGLVGIGRIVVWWSMLAVCARWGTIDVCIAAPVYRKGSCEI